MGYMTVVCFFNDDGSTVKKYPELVANNVFDAMRSYYHEEESFKKHFYNGVNMTAIASEHADYPQVTVAWMNSFDRIGYNGTAGKLEHRKEILEAVKRVVRDEEEIIKRMEREQENS